jgi:4-amino-4-deoxy-L-arabinose transferase-like glycosyltransferase
LLGLAACRLVLYAIAIPPWEAPDEPSHFAYVLSFARAADAPGPAPQPPLRRTRARRAPGSGEQADITLHPGTSAHDLAMRSSRPPLYYALLGASLRLLQVSGRQAQVKLLRAGSILITLGLVLLTWLASRRLFPGREELQLLATAFVAFLPQLGATGMAISSDGLGNLLAAAALLATILALQEQHPLRNMLLATLALAAAAFTSRLSLIAAPGLAAAAILLLRRRKTPWRRQAMVLAATALLLTSGTVILGYLWPAALFKTVFSITRTPSVSLLRSFLTTADLPEHWTLKFLRLLFESFVLRYGWMDYALPGAAYALWSLPAAVALGATLVRRRKDRHPDRKAPTAWLWITPAAGLAACFLIVGLGGNYAQGRYLFPALPNLALLLARGFANLTPGPRRRRITLAAAAFLALFDMACLLGWIVPTYTP